MDKELESLLDRADEILQELEEEYDNCLHSQTVTERAKNLTHEVLEKLRNALDQSMWRAWESHIAPTLSEEEKKRARIYFPITGDLHSFRSTLGRGHMADLQQTHNDLYNFLLAQQPFSSEKNLWLSKLAEIARWKHIKLIPQKRKEAERINVSGRGGGSVSWNPSSVKFGSGVKIMGAPVDPRTQRIVPTPGVTERFEKWISFILDGHDVNALGFCKEACQKTRALIKDMTKIS